MDESTSSISRRDLVLAGAGLLLAGGSAAAAPVARGKPLRIAHLTDMHVKPEASNGEGYAMALDSLTRLDPIPDLIVTGGDHIMDALVTSRDRAVVQWDLYERVLSQNTKLPVYPVLGNHDIWGWSVKEPLDESAPGFGKALALDRLKLNCGYYSFDAGGWHLVVLDNIARRGGGYYADLDPQQLEWLKGDLQSNRSRKPVCIFSHIPFLCVSALFFNQKPTVFWRVNDNLMHHDVKPLLPVFMQNNVRLLVSGHIHLGDRVDFKGMSFICDAAVSGSWWGGPFQEFPEGYGVLDLWPDGTFEHQYRTYGWKAGT